MARSWRLKFWRRWSLSIFPAKLYPASSPSRRGSSWIHVEFSSCQIDGEHHGEIRHSDEDAVKGCQTRRVDQISVLYTKTQEGETGENWKKSGGELTEIVVVYSRGRNYCKGKFVEFVGLWIFDSWSNELQILPGIVRNFLDFSDVQIFDRFSTEYQEGWRHHQTTQRPPRKDGHLPAGKQTINWWILINYL